MVASKNMKCVRIILSEYAQGIYIEKHITLPRESKNDISKCWDTPCSWIGKHNIVKTSIFPKLIYILNVVSKFRRNFGGK